MVDFLQGRSRLSRERVCEGIGTQHCVSKAKRSQQRRTEPWRQEPEQDPRIANIEVSTPIVNFLHLRSLTKQRSENRMEPC